MTIESLRADWAKRLAEYERVCDLLQLGKLGTLSVNTSTTAESLTRMLGYIANFEKMLRETAPVTAWPTVLSPTGGRPRCCRMDLIPDRRSP